MAKKYTLWDKKSDVFFFDGSMKTAEEWLTERPIARNPGAHIIVTAGPINGGRFDVLEQLIPFYESQGADFSEATTPEEQLDVLEAWEDNMNAPGDTTESTPEERIAAALELANVINLPTVNDDDPDAE